MNCEDHCVSDPDLGCTSGVSVHGYGQHIAHCSDH